MAALAHAKCLNHDAREAVCRCPVCRRFFCRECVVSFEARWLCASCLNAQALRPDQQRAKRGLGIAPVTLAALGLLLVWLLFYLAGWMVVQFRERPPVAAIFALRIVA